MDSTNPEIIIIHKDLLEKYLTEVEKDPKLKNVPIIIEFSNFQNDFIFIDENNIPDVEKKKQTTRSFLYNMEGKDQVYTKE